MEKVKMVTFKTHMREDVLLNPGDEFEVDEKEAHRYAARKRLLAGPLGEEDEAAPRKAKPRGRSTRRKAK